MRTPPCSKEWRHGSLSNCMPSTPFHQITKFLSKATVINAHPDAQTHCLLGPGTSSTIGPPQQRKGHHTRTLCCTVGLGTPSPFFLIYFLSLHYNVIHHFDNSPCFISHWIPCFLYTHTSRDHIIVWLPCCIYTPLPVSVNYSLTKATISCRNVRNSWALASVSTNHSK